MFSSRLRQIHVAALSPRYNSSYQLVGMELVALCDTWEDKLREVGEQFRAKGREVTLYTDYGKLLEHDLDAVILANYYHEHAPFAIRALEAGKHVMSECAACHTLAEGVALIRAVEKSKKSTCSPRIIRTRPTTRR